MMQLGKVQTLTLLRMKDAGAYLGEKGSEDSVLLPRAEVPEGAGPGTEIPVFLYRDSEDRLIATTKTPPMEVGGIAKLKVAQETEIGAFLEWGLLKDLFLPFKEQRMRLKPGMEVLVALYVDKSQRLCATMNLYPYLQNDATYQKNDRVSGTVYEVKEGLGAFLAVDDRYFGMIPEQELYTRYTVGEQVTARVLKVRPDGKLDLSGRKKAYVQMDEDSERVWNAIQEYDGVLPFTDKADAEQIKQELQLSKNAFKRAVGRLLKEGKIEIKEKTIEAKKKK